MKKEIYLVILPMLAIADAELAMFSKEVLLGLGIHVVNLLAITFIIIFSSLDTKIKYILQSLALVVLLRMINLATPQFFTTTMLQYPLIYGVMFIPIYYIVKSQKISAKELGIDFSRLYVYIPSAILIGSIAAIVEYRIINPVALIENIRLPNIVLISIIMLVFIGVVEELIFRSVLQTRLTNVVGWKYGILISGTIFGIMHASYGIPGEIIFAIMLGIILGYIFHKSRSLPFVVSIHGIANVILFGILPFYGIGRLI